MSRKAVIVFLKNPEPGKVKTRLAKDLGDEKALLVYQKLIAHTLDEVSKTKGEVFLFYDRAFPENQLFGVNYRLQEGSDLGEKMLRAFEEVFQDGVTKAVIIGSDCPEISSEIIHEAFQKLNPSDAVIGPALDGGYYLLGLKKPHKELFLDKTWSIDSVFDRTLSDLKKLKWSYSLLPTLSDLDTIDDYRKFPEYHI